MKLPSRILLAAATLVAASSHADTMFTISGLNTRNDFTGTIGATFTVGSTDLLLTALGVQDFGDNGLTQSHEVGIWGSGANALTSVTVTNTDPLLNHFRYVDTSYTLLAGQTYFIGAVMYSGGDAWSDGGVANVSGLSPLIAANTYDSKYSSGGVLAKPTIDSATTNLRWGPANMQFTAVPEPSTYGLIGAGTLAAAAFVRRRRKLAGKAV